MFTPTRCYMAGIQRLSAILTSRKADTKFTSTNFSEAPIADTRSIDVRGDIRHTADAQKIIYVPMNFYALTD